VLHGDRQQVMIDALDHLSALRVFEAVARLGSARQAATELAVTDGAVSKQIKALEAALNVELFIRGHRKLILTPAGERLAPTLTMAFETIVRSVEQAERTGKAGQLVIAAPSTFLVRWFMPRLPRLLERVRGTEINVLTWNKDPIATDRSIDIHIVVGPDDPIPGMTRHDIGPETFGPVASPSLMPPSSEPDSILGLRRLATSWPTAMWRNWAAETGRDLAEGETLRFERLIFAVEAAEAGLGAALAPGPSVWDALAAGRLVAPLGLHRREGNWGLCWRTDQTSGLHMSVLRWFQAEFARSESALPKVD
jgi:LysR family glycine cleavage system transcriptional activator